MTFLSTPSARRATDPAEVTTDLMQISIHALREEGDSSRVRQLSYSAGFLSTPSARRATQEIYAQGNTQDISIHALREEGDLAFFFFFGKIDMISIHALREEGDPMLANLGEQAVLFLSTPSARRATYNIKRVIGAH